MANRVGFAKIGLDSIRAERIAFGILFNLRRDVSGSNRPKRFPLLRLRVAADWGGDYFFVAWFLLNFVSFATDIGFDANLKYLPLNLAGRT